MGPHYEFPDTGRTRATLQFWGAAAQFAVSVTVDEIAARLKPARHTGVRATGRDDCR